MTEAASHRSVHERQASIQWEADSPLTMKVETRSGIIQTRHGWFVGGAADRVEVVEVDTGAVRVTLLPTRGMAIWCLEAGGFRFGWRSPVAGPVHPSQVPLFDPNGLGWLEGFDELLVRCGLESNGAPEHDGEGRLVYPLHGRIGNLPADSLSIEYDEASGRLEVIGEVCEAKLFFKNLRLAKSCATSGGQLNRRAVGRCDQRTLPPGDHAAVVSHQHRHSAAGSRRRAGSTDRRAGTQRHAVGR